MTKITIVLKCLTHSRRYLADIPVGSKCGQGWEKRYVLSSTKRDAIRI